MQKQPSQLTGKKPADQSVHEAVVAESAFPQKSFVLGVKIGGFPNSKFLATREISKGVIPVFTSPDGFWFLPADDLTQCFVEGITPQKI